MGKVFGISNSFSLFPSKVELQALMKYYDVDGDGNIGYEEFLQGLKEDLSERKQAMVDKAFNILDKDGSGVVTVCDVKHIYDVRENQDFIDGTKTKEEIVGEFLDSFDGARGNDDGKITKQEFDSYYAELSMSVPSEQYFVRMMEQVWGIAENDSGVAYREQIAEFISQIRLRILTMANNNVEEFVLRKIFAQFDTNQSGTITIDELGAMIAGLKLSCERKFLNGIFRVIDTNNSGGIEFEEFLNYIVNDPYR